MNVGKWFFISSAWSVFSINSKYLLRLVLRNFYLTSLGGEEWGRLMQRTIRIVNISILINNKLRTNISTGGVCLRRKRAKYDNFFQWLMQCFFSFLFFRYLLVFSTRNFTAIFIPRKQGLGLNKWEISKLCRNPWGKFNKITFASRLHL